MDDLFDNKDADEIAKLEQKEALGDVMTRPLPSVKDPKLWLVKCDVSVANLINSSQCFAKFGGQFYVVSCLAMFCLLDKSNN